MTDTTNNSEDILKKLSRRKLLRDSSITAAGAVLLPSFLTGCHKDVWDIVKRHGSLGGVGGPVPLELTPGALEQAANNLTTLRQLLIEVYDLAKQYDDAVFHSLNSTKTNSWTNFIVDLFIDIALGIAASLAIATATPAAMPAIALIGAVLKDWGIGKARPNTLQAFYSDFEFGRVAMQDAIEKKLSHLVDPSNNYSNLQAAWKDPIVFNGTSYTLPDLASTNFTLGDEYNKLHDAAYTHMKKSVWNLLIMKCCTYYPYRDFATTPKHPGALLEYAQNTFYRQNKGVYLRANLWNIQSDYLEWELLWWNLGIGGNPFPDGASKILFIDDTPGHSINPDGLFNRSYVFQQFSVTKPDFSDGHELNDNPANGNGDFALSDDWTFTGGMFPELTKQ